jgi:hypothetical protein
LAVALALAGGLGAPTLAFAKDKAAASSEGKSQYTKAFVDAYNPFKAAVDKATDDASAEAVRPQAAAVVAAITNDDERYAAGTELLQLGLKLKDKDMQRQSLIMQLDSGKVTPDKLAVFNYYVGGFSYDKDDYDNAEKYLTQAFNLGYREHDIASLIAESYFQQKKDAQGLAEIKRMEQVSEAAGAPLPEATLRRGLKAVYDAHDGAQIADWAALVVKHYPKPETWNMALSVIRDSYQFQPDEVLDLYRLMRVTKSMQTKRDYVFYIDSADARKLPNEVVPLMQEGISKGLLDANDAYVTETLKVAQSHAADDRASAEQMGQDAQKAANGVPARAAGDNFLALNQPQKAEAMYKLAVQKGGVEADRMTMRTGVAQAMAGEDAAARQSFQAVTGTRAPIAKMWVAYLDSKTAAPAAPTPPATPTPPAAQ